MPSNLLLSITLGFILGLAILHQMPMLPDNMYLFYGMFLSISIIVLIWLAVAFKINFKIRYRHKLIHKSFSVFIISAILAFSYASYRSNLRLQYRLPVEYYNTTHHLQIKVTSLPIVSPDINSQHNVKFKAEVLQAINQNQPDLNHKLAIKNIMLSNFNDNFNKIKVGDIYNIQAKLKPPYSMQNPDVFDYEFYLFSNNIHAMASSTKQEWKYIDNTGLYDSTWVEQLRYKIEHNMLPFIEKLPHKAIILALTIGNQAYISTEQWKLFNRSGIGHLISISGLHITMLAIIMGLLPLIFIRIWPNICNYIRKKNLCAISGLSSALLYTLISGSEIPAVRTYLMLFIAVVLYKRFNIAVNLSISCLCILIFDPWAIASSSFWLSFGAIALLIFMAKHSSNNTQQNKKNKDIHKNIKYMQILRSSIVMQLGISLAMIPLCILIFGQFSIVSPLANMIAIPLISYIIAPFALLSACLSSIDINIINYASIKIFDLCNFCIDICIAWCTQTLTMPIAYAHAAYPSLPVLVLSIVGMICILLPYKWRWYGVVLMLPLISHENHKINPTSKEIFAVFFDVGQGNSILIKTANHSLLFDTGAITFSRKIIAENTIIPALQRIGIKKIDDIVISHADADHIGGLGKVLENFDVSNILVGMPLEHPSLIKALKYSKIDNKPDISQCAPKAWQYDGVAFIMLAPSYGHDFAADFANNTDNNSSCVLKIVSGSNSILLTGDLESPTELNMIEQYQDLLASDILLAPHHGSKTSSSMEFLQKVKPSHIIVQNGFFNTYKHPNTNVMERYNQIGSKIWRSDYDGAVMLDMGQSTYSIYSQRGHGARYWRTY
jgi:competence protein ComEC